MLFVRSQLIFSLPYIPYAGANRQFWQFPYTGSLELTPPCGGEHQSSIRCTAGRGFNSRPREGERRAVESCYWQILTSTHAPCGGECVPVVAISSAMQLQLTPPCGGELWSLTSSNFNAKASTRAPVWGANRTTAAEAYVRDYFNSRPPCGRTVSSNL